jgi:hypothetical protein
VVGKVFTSEVLPSKAPSIRFCRRWPNPPKVATLLEWVPSENLATFGAGQFSKMAKRTEDAQHLGLAIFGELGHLRAGNLARRGRVYLPLSGYRTAG